MYVNQIYDFHNFVLSKKNCDIGKDELINQLHADEFYWIDQVNTVNTVQNGM